MKIGKVAALIVASLMFIWPAMCGTASTEIKKSDFGAYMGGGLGLYASQEIWQKEIACARYIGVGIARFNSDAWDVLEPREGEYHWEALDRLVELLRSSELDVLFTIPISSSWNTTWVSSPQGIAKSHFPTADLSELNSLCFNLASRYAGKIRYWEVWNEPDLGIFWKGEPDAKEYIDLLKESYEGLKRGSPNCTVVIGGLANPFDDTYIRTLLANGAAEYCDVMNIHVYTKNPADLERAINNVRLALSDYNVTKPLWITEISTTPDYYSSGDVDKEEVDKARYLVKAYAIAFSSGVEKIFWHSLRKCGKDVGLDRDFEFGMMTADFGILPAYIAHGVLAPRLTGATFTKKTVSSQGVTAYKFTKKLQSIYVVWSAGRAALFTLPGTAKKAVAYNISGTIVRPARRGQFVWPVGDSPIVVEVE